MLGHKEEQWKVITISLCMIVKNEEDALENCLSSVAEIVDEIIIVDTGSTDKTKEIAQKFTDNIYDFTWIHDFSAARNFAFSKATKDYIMWLDADDIIRKKDQKKLKELKKTLSKDVDSVMMNYHLGFDSEGQPSFSIRRNRLVKRSRNFQWIGFVHEYLAVSGNIFQSDIAITHNKQKEHTNRNLLIYENALANGLEFSPRDVYYYANECRDNGKYETAIEYYEKFLEDKKGWVEDNIQACGKLADCYKHLDQKEKAIESCVRSFTYDTPRGEICCRLGFIYLNQSDYHKAIAWYKIAANLNIPENSPFLERHCYTWLPNLQLCLCYSKIGNNVEAKKYNEIAASFNPSHPSIQYNQRYFEKLALES